MVSIHVTHGLRKSGRDGECRRVLVGVGVSRLSLGSCDSDRLLMIDMQLLMNPTIYIITENINLLIKPCTSDFRPRPLPDFSVGRFLCTML